MCAAATRGERSKIHFCPDCGSSVFWYAEFASDLIGIAFGAFADPSTPRPTLSVWETTRHPWVTFDHRLDRFAVQPEIDKLNLERPLGSPDDQVRAAKPGETANA